MLTIKFVNTQTTEVIDEVTYNSADYARVQKAATNEASKICSNTGRYKDAYTGCLAEFAYSLWLEKQDIDVAHPGYIKDYGKIIGDKGDLILFENDEDEYGYVVDVKTSDKHPNVGYRPRKAYQLEKYNFQIDEILGTHIKYDHFSCTLYVYGFLEIKEAYKWDLGYSEYCMVLPPRAFKHKTLA